MSPTLLLSEVYYHAHAAARMTEQVASAQRVSIEFVELLQKETSAANAKAMELLVTIKKQQNEQ